MKGLYITPAFRYNLSVIILEKEWLKVSDSMGMSDKQYDGLILDTIEDLEELKELAETKDIEKLLKKLNQKIEKNRSKLER